MDINAELAQLREQLTQLKQQFDELRQFVSVQERDDGHKILLLNCTTLLLQNPGRPEHLQGMLCAGDEGPTLSLWGSDGKARLTLSVEQDQGTIELFQTDFKLGVHIGVDKENRPCVGVFDEGKPRAALKSNAQGGVVTVVHDDGLMRASMTSQTDCGEILLANADMKAAVKISSNGQHGGGLLTVNHPNGKAAVILSSLPQTGCVILNDEHGTIKYALPAPNAGGTDSADD